MGRQLHMYTGYGRNMPDKVAKFTFDMSPELLIYVDVPRFYRKFQNAAPPG